MGMTKLFCGIAAVSLIAGVAMAEPQKSNAPGKSGVVKSIQLSDKQMDKVNAGFLFRELDVSDTSITAVFIGQPATAVTGLISTSGACGACYLSLVSPNLSIFSAMGPTGQ